MLLTRSRRGFTLIELLIVLVVLSIVGLMALRMLTGTQRATTTQAELATLQANTRAGALIVPSELREMNPAQGDLIAMLPNSVTYRAMRGVGVTCLITPENLAAATVTLLRASTAGNVRAIQAGRDSLLISRENDPKRMDDDTWQRVGLANGPVATTCAGANADTYTLKLGSGLTPSIVTDSVGQATPVRVYEVMQLAAYQSGGKWWLGARSLSAGEAALQPVLGPLADSAGVNFQYFDSTGTATAIAANVRSIGMRITGLSSRPVYKGMTGAPALVRDSQTVRIFVRNGP